MTSPRMLLVHNVDPCAFTALREAGVSVDAVNPGMRPEELVAKIHECGAQTPVMLGIRSKTKVPASVLSACPQLVAVGAFCIGTDQIDLEAAQAAGVAVFNAPFGNTRSVAELVLGEMIMLARQIFPKSTAAHQGRWQKTSQGAHEVRGKTLGIVGYGHIGSQLSVLAESLGLSVQYFDIEPKLPLGNARRSESLQALYASSDIVTFHVPDTPRTRNMLDAQAMTHLRPGALVINASRGRVVDLEALAHALDTEAVAGAAIDVYPQEPKSTKEPFECPLQGKSQVILTPHIGGSTHEAQQNIGHEVSAALLSYLRCGNSSRNHSLPALDLGDPGACVRIINVHRNEAGAASAINQCVASAGHNIEAQQLATRGSIGMMSLDVSFKQQEGAARLREQLLELPHVIRARIVGF